MIGRTLFYDVEDGTIIVDTGEKPKRATYREPKYYASRLKLLSERNRDTFDYVELEYGQFKRDFDECNGVKVNPDTKQIEFSYPDPNEPEVEQPYQAPLSEQVDGLKQTNNLLTSELAKVKIDLMLLKGGVS